MMEEKVRRRDIFKKRLKALTTKEVLLSMKESLDNAYKVFKSKLHDYGLETYKMAGGIGILMEIRKKFFRIDNLLRSDTEPNYESIRDSVQDLQVYITAFLAMIDKKLIDLDEIREQYVDIYGVKTDEENDDTT